MDFNDIVACWPFGGVEDSVATANATYLTWDGSNAALWPPFDVYIVGLQAAVTTAIDNPTIQAVAAVMVFNAAGSAVAVTNTLGASPSAVTGEVLTLSYTDNATVGTVLQESLTPDEYVLVTKTSGHNIRLLHKTAGTGGGPGGVVRLRLMLKIAARNDFSTASSA